MGVCVGVSRICACVEGICTYVDACECVSSLGVCVCELQQELLPTKLSEQLFSEIARVALLLFVVRFLFFGDREGRGSYSGWVGEERGSGSGEVDVCDVGVTSLSELK